MKMKKTLIAAAGVLLCVFEGFAFVDAAGAGTSAAGLSAAAKAIDDATAPNVTAGADLRAVVTTQTTSFVMNGTIGRGAKAAAKAAGGGLAMLP